MILIFPAGFRSQEIFYWAEGFSSSFRLLWYPLIFFPWSQSSDPFMVRTKVTSFSAISVSLASVSSSSTGFIQQIGSVVEIHGDGQLHQASIGGDLVMFHFLCGDDECGRRGSCCLLPFLVMDSTSFVIPSMASHFFSSAFSPAFPKTFSGV